MAKSKGFFGLRSGSTKNFTFSELNGQQITKERVYKVKNPRTLQQMRQRMVMASVSAAYSYLKEICDHSFEGFGVGSPCMSEFMRLNLDALKTKAQNDSAVVAFNAFQDKNINPVPFVVAKGSLDEIVPTIEYGSLLYWSTPINDADTTTAEGIYAALGLKRGDLITFIVCGGDFVNNAALTFAPQPLGIIRLHADKQGAVSSIADAFTVESNNQSNVYVDFNMDPKYINIIASCDKLVMGAVIVSRKAADKWLRSNATMVVKTEIPATTVSRQLATYPVERDLILNGSGLAKKTSSLPKPSLSLSATSVSITTPNGTANAPTLSGAPSGATVTYSIANSKVASIDPSSGVATAKANGQTSVTISVSATETTGATSISYTLNVTGQDSDAETGGGGDADAKPHNG